MQNHYKQLPQPEYAEDVPSYADEPMNDMNNQMNQQQYQYIQQQNIPNQNNNQFYSNVTQSYQPSYVPPQQVYNQHHYMSHQPQNHYHMNNQMNFPQMNQYNNFNNNEMRQPPMISNYNPQNTIPFAPKQTPMNKYQNELNNNNSNSNHKNYHDEEKDIPTIDVTETNKQRSCLQKCANCYTIGFSIIFVLVLLFIVINMFAVIA